MDAWVFQEQGKRFVYAQSVHNRQNPGCRGRDVVGLVTEWIASSARVCKPTRKNDDPRSLSWLNQLRKHRNGPQMIEIEVGDSVANNIVEPSKDSHDLYVSKLEAEQVRAAIQELQ